MPDRVDIASQFLIDFPDFDVQPLADIKQYRAEMNQLAEIWEISWIELKFDRPFGAPISRWKP